MNITEKRIGIIGAGKVGATLASVFKKKGFQVSMKTKTTPPRYVSYFLKEMKIQLFRDSGKFAENSDVIIICTQEKDIGGALSEISKFLDKKHLIAHTSASFSANDKIQSVSVFHPFMSFPAVDTGIEDFSGFIFGISCPDKYYNVFSELAKKIGARPVKIREDLLPLYHASAVMLVEGMIKSIKNAAEILEKSGVDRKTALKTCTIFSADIISNIENMGTEKAETGPLARKSEDIIRKHIKALKKHCPEKLALYLTLMKSKAKA